MMTKSKTDLGELSRMMEMLTQATDRLGGSYEMIAKLQQEIAEKDRLLAKKTRLEMLGRMAAGLAHEIRNPLGGIALYTKMLRRDLSGQPEKVENLDKILGAVTNLDRLVEDMLTFGGNLQPQKVPQGVRRVVGDALTLARLDGIEVRCDDLDAEPPMDAGMMQRVFLNLILNAAQAMEKGGVLDILGERDGDTVRILFRDSGPGIPDPERIFTPFYTTKAKGTGLGLAIAKKIVEAHDGKLDAFNHDGGGATFRIQLPCPASL